MADSEKEVWLETLLETTRQLSLGDDAPQGMVPSLKGRNTARAQFTALEGKCSHQSLAVSL